MKQSSTKKVKQTLYFWTLILNVHTVEPMWSFFFIEPSRTLGGQTPQMMPKSVHPSDSGGEAVLVPSCEPFCFSGENGLKSAPASFIPSHSGLPGLTRMVLWQAGVQSHVVDWALGLRRPCVSGRTDVGLRWWGTDIPRVWSYDCLRKHSLENKSQHMAPCFLNRISLVGF